MIFCGISRVHVVKLITKLCGNSGIHHASIKSFCQRSSTELDQQISHLHKVACGKIGNVTDSTD
jgi:hypothetical protein